MTPKEIQLRTKLAHADRTLEATLGLARIAETLTGCRGDDDYVRGVKHLIEDTLKAIREDKP